MGGEKKFLGGEKKSQISGEKKIPPGGEKKALWDMPVHSKSIFRGETTKIFEALCTKFVHGYNILHCKFVWIMGGGWKFWPMREQDS